MLRSLLYLLNALVFLGGAAFGVIAAIDELSDPTPKLAAAPGDPGEPPSYQGSGRVFILFVDSLRDKTAESPELMPNLARLAREGAHARVETVYDAVTAPAVRAAFTGRSHFRVLGFVQNFVKRSKKVPSLLSQVSEAGGRTVVFSEKKTFSQFGDDVHEEYSNAIGYEGTASQENAQARKALDLFHSGKHRVVLFHVLYLDYVAHRRGIVHPEYREDVASLDALIGELDAGIGPDDTFVVLGDHGHTETGRHALGLDVPTYLLLRGPGFRPGADLGLVHITSYRYFLSWALKLPLAADYARGRHPEAFTAANLPPSFAPTAEATEAIPKLPFGTFVVLALAVGVAFTLWWTVGRVIHAGDRHGFVLGDFLRTLAVSTSASVPLMALGALMAALRSYVHEPFYPTIYRVWGFVLVAVLVLSRRFDLAKLGLAVLCLPFLLLWPTTYRYGSTAVFAPAWLCWATGALFLSFGFRDGLPTAKYFALGKRWKVRKSVVLVAGIFLLVQPFFFTDAVNFVFTEFKGLVPELVPKALWAQALVGAAATGIVFYRPAEGWPSASFAAVCAGYFLAVFFHVVPEGSRSNFFLGCALLGIALVVRRRVRMGFFHAKAQGTVRSLFLAALFVFYFYFVRAASQTRLDAMMLFAALRLSVLLVDHLPMTRRNAPLNALFLQILGLIVAGWVTLAWGLERLEWHAAYDFFPPRLVEEYVGLFLPLIVVKYSLPVLISRMLIRERFAAEKEYPAKETALFAGLKFASLILLTLGIGYYTAGSGVYLEAAGELAIFMSLAAGLL